MRFYALGNYYLSSIQQGIQAFHCLGDMMNEYPAKINVDEYSKNYITANRMFHDWAENHKTLICLNGGNNMSLKAAAKLFDDGRNTGFPYMTFHEDEQSMDGMLTCVGIVVPEYIYEAEARVIASDSESTTYGYFYNDKHLSTWEEEVFLKIKNCSLAR
jgi:hypothetical protein